MLPLYWYACIYCTIVQQQRGPKTSSTRHTGSSGRQPARPTISSQVVIQSEQEKQLKKIHRREDRRLARQQAKGEGSQQNEADHFMDFDPEYLRKQRCVHWRCSISAYNVEDTIFFSFFLLREAELELASNRPFFTGTPVRIADPNELYPHVYDSMAKAKLTSAILEGKTVGETKDCYYHIII